MKAKRLSKVQRSSRARRLDIITTLPQTIIEIILCLLPIEEAARTSILSREWRFKWTKIPKLVFDNYTVKLSTEKWHLSNRNQISVLEKKRRDKEIRCKLFCAIHQVLLQHQGPIQEFTLSMESVHTDEPCFEIDQIILHLSRNHTLKRLTLVFCRYVPLCVFSLHHLTDLCLEHCEVNLKPIFNGLGNLVRLTLYRSWMPRETLLHLLSSCPSLKSLCVMLEKQVRGPIGNPSIMELFKCLTQIEHLTTWGYIKTSAQDLVPGEFPPTLINLKYFCIKELCFGRDNRFAFLGVMFKCSPNLEKIKLEIETDDGYDTLEYNLLEYREIEENFSLLLQKYSDVWLEHLTELEILYYRNEKLELDLLKFILARSPNLKKVKFQTWIMFGSRKDLKMLRTLFRPPRASPVEFIFDDI